VKDRIGVAMIEAAEREGGSSRAHDDRRGDVGNTGIALAFCCAAKGYDLAIFLPQGMSREREALLRLYGARVEVVESMGGMNEAVDAAARWPRTATSSCPTSSPTRQPEAHRRGPGPRSCARSTAASTCFVAGVGTGGTITGAGEAIKAATQARDRRRRAARLRGALGRRPGPHGSRASAPASCRGPGHADPRRGARVPDEDAIALARRARPSEGILAGISCGAALWGASQVAARPESRGKRIVTHPAGLGRALHLGAVLRARWALTYRRSHSPASGRSRASPARSVATSPRSTTATPRPAASPRARSC
jgi:cysteine synthase A